MMSLRLWGLFLSGILAAVSLAAQAPKPANAPVTPEQRQAANDLFTARNWPQAAQAYETITRLEPQNAGAWYRLGYSLHSAQQYERAAAAFEKSVALNSNPLALYNLACAYTMAQNTDKGLENLEKAIAGGFGNPARIKNDPDLTSLHNTARFNKILDDADRLARPCEYDPRARQFDFWIGEWEVRTQQGQLAGTNTVQRLTDGCILLENWTGQLGGHGKSMNFFDPGLGQWRQIWRGGTGEVLDVAGTYQDNALRLEGELRNANGTKVPARLTFFKLAEGRVRQLGEQSNDGGKTWTTTYDLVYTPRKPATSEK